MKYFLHDGFIVDGTGKEGWRGSVLLEDGMISKVGADIAAPRDAKVIECAGRVIAPGFIDIHRHADAAMVRDEDFGLVELAQGITTTLIGNCGLAPVPVKPESKDEYFDYLEPVTGPIPEGFVCDTYANYVKYMRSRRYPLNVGFLAGSDSIKIAVKGFTDAPYTPEELRKAAGLMKEAMDAGAFGGTLGIMYLPECYSTADELAEVVRPIGEVDGLLSTHIRGEGDSLVSSVEEVIEVAKKAGVRLNISHFKATGLRNWNRLVPEAIEKIEEARAEGTPVTCDFYPYDGGSTTLQSLLPPAIMNKGITETFKYLATDEGKKYLREALDSRIEGWDNMAESIGWERILISSVSLPKNQFMSGRDIKSVADELGYEYCSDLVADLYVEEKGKVGIIVLSMAESDVETIARLPYSVLISDSLYGGGGNPHPRLYGSFPRFLRVFVGERNILSFEEAVHKMTLMPAERAHIEKRGAIREGWHADVLVFGKDTFRDHAEYYGKHRPATGMDHVFIDGEPAFEDGRMVSAVQGEFLIRK